MTPRLGPVVTAFAIAALLIGPDAVGAQVGLEVRAGAAVGNHVPARAGLELHPGPSVSAAVDVAFRPRLSAYAAYTLGEFQCEGGFCVGRDVTIRSVGYGVGLRYVPVGPLWVRAGVLRHGVDVEADEVPFPTDPALGFDLGAGAAVRVIDSGSVVAGLGLRSHPDPDSRTTVATAEIGVRYEF